MKPKKILFPSVVYGATLVIVFYSEYIETGSVNESIIFIIVVVISTISMIALITLITLLIFYIIWRKTK